MIEKVFLLKLALSFLVAGGYLVSVVAISERVSPKVGGILAGIPTTTRRYGLYNLDRGAPALVARVGG